MYGFPDKCAIHVCCRTKIAARSLFGILDAIISQRLGFTRVAPHLPHSVHRPSSSGTKYEAPRMQCRHSIDSPSYNVAIHGFEHRPNPVAGENPQLRP